MESRSTVILGSKAAIKDQRGKHKASGRNLHKKDQNPLKKSTLGLEMGEEKGIVRCGSHSGEPSPSGNNEGRSIWISWDRQQQNYQCLIRAETTGCSDLGLTVAATL